MVKCFVWHKQKRSDKVPNMINVEMTRGLIFQFKIIAYLEYTVVVSVCFIYSWLHPVFLNFSTINDLNFIRVLPFHYSTFVTFKYQKSY